MSPARFASNPTEAVASGLSRFWVTLGSAIRGARRAKNWSAADLAARASLSRDVVYLLERGQSVSVEAAIRAANALGLRLEIALVDPRKRDRASANVDLVHSFMGEFEARHFRERGFPTAIDEPYQHYQFAGRADFVAWDLGPRALLHIENRTRFPDLQAAAGSFNAKREYLGRVMAERAGVGRWASETHVVAALWSAEVLHTLRLRPESFRSICPDDVQLFNQWWSGQAPSSGLARTLVVMDPTAEGRQRPWISLDEALAAARPRHRGYADVASKLAGRR